MEKHYLRKLFFAIFLFIYCVATNAYDFEVDGIYYNIVSVDDLTVNVTHGDNKYIFDVVIPSKVTYASRVLTIVGIGDNAFNGCGGLGSITIPDGVTSIGNYAFKGCNNLKSITIPSRVTSIGSYAFSGCTGLTSITIPSSVTSIGNAAFDECSSIKDLRIEDGETALSLGYNYYNNSASPYIGEGLFHDCPLESIYLGRNLSYERTVNYGYSPFYGLKALKSVTIGNSVTNIGYYAFRGCTGLTSIALGNSVTNIGEYAFSGCSGLTSIYIPSSVTGIGNAAFDGCTSLKDLHIEDGETTLSLGYNYYNGQRQGLFCDCPLESIYLGRNLSYVTNSSYGGCSPFYGEARLKSLTIGGSVTRIGDYEFAHCTGLTSIAIPNSVRSIGEYAFWGCSGLTSITIPNSVTSIGHAAFRNCSSIKDLRIEDGEKNLYLRYDSDRKKGLFYDCPLESIYLGRNLSYDTSEECGYSPFYGKTRLKSLTIGGSVTSIGEYVFRSCTGLTSVTIPNSVTSIGEYAFYNCI